MPWLGTIAAESNPEYKNWAGTQEILGAKGEFWTKNCTVSIATQPSRMRANLRNGGSLVGSFLNTQFLGKGEKFYGYFLIGLKDEA